jgi:membrane protease YdiL (CAAX protease family)
MPSFNFIAYTFLYLAVITLWFPSPRVAIWPITLSIAVILAVITHQMTLVSLIPVIMLPGALYYSKHTTGSMSAVAITGVLILCLGLALHLFPGFHSLKVIDHAYLRKDAMPYTMYLNFDKTLAGIFILGITQKLISRKKDWYVVLKQTVLPTLAMVLVVIAFALLLGFVCFEPRLPNHWLVWTMTNLLFVCTAEEAFFRGFLQNKFSQALKNQAQGESLAILIAAILFGLAHFAGGYKYILLATVAGLGYGWIYARTKRIEASIIMHFSVNLVHFMFFTYPMLA